jgi:hypothetical protein
MRSPITALRDFSRARGHANALYEQVRRSRPHGVDVSRQDPEFCAGLMLLLKKHPTTLKVVKNDQRLTLHFTSDLDAVFSVAERSGARFHEVIAHPDEDLVHGT